MVRDCRYFPYFRGKQYELITIRECAATFRRAAFCPIIEPVKQQTKGLFRALNQLEENEVASVVIVNPGDGYHSSVETDLTEQLLGYAADSGLVHCGVLLSPDMSTNEAHAILERCSGTDAVLIHAGYSGDRDVIDAFSRRANVKANVFVDERTTRLYRRHFRDPGNFSVLVRDGFKKRRNRDHPLSEAFSDLHLTYADEGMDAFGDYLVVGSDYSEGGGPAYAVAIHITYFDQTKDDEMQIFHFVSDTTDTPTDPAGKFAEALAKLVREARKPHSMITQTDSIEEFYQLSAKQHYPGLGYVKKLSMNHHIQTMAHYFDR